MLDILTQEQVSYAITFPSFVFFCKQIDTPLPEKQNTNYFFKDLMEELGFAMTFKGFQSACDFGFENPHLIPSSPVKYDPNDINDACTNLYFLDCARKQKLPLPLKVNNKYEFKDNFQEISFKTFYSGWKGCLNIMNSNN